MKSSSFHRCSEYVYFSFFHNTLSEVLLCVVECLQLVFSFVKLQMKRLSLCCVVESKSVGTFLCFNDFSLSSEKFRRQVESSPEVWKLSRLLSFLV